MLHYFAHEEVKSLVRDMAEYFPGGCFVFDFISEKNRKDGNNKVKDTDNNTQIVFYMNDAEKEMAGWSDRLTAIRQKSYLEGYPVEGICYNFITKLYIKSGSGLAETESEISDETGTTVLCAEKMHRKIRIL